MSTVTSQASGVRVWQKLFSESCERPARLVKKSSLTRPLQILQRKFIKTCGTVVVPLRKSSTQSLLISSVFVWLERCFILFSLFRMSRLCVCLLASPRVDPFNTPPLTCSDLWLLWFCAGCVLYSLGKKEKEEKSVFPEEIKHIALQWKHGPKYNNTWNDEMA